MSGMSVDRLDELLPNDVARWVKGGAVLALGGYVISLIMGTIIVPGAFWSRIGEFGVVILSLVAIFMVDAGRTRAAGLLVLIGVWFELHFSLIWDGLISAPGIATLPAMVTLAALFLGKRAGFIFAFSTVFSLPAITWVNHQVSGEPGFASGPEVGFWIIVPITCFATATLMGLGLDSLGRAVVSARGNEERFAGLVARVPDAVLALDHNGVIETANEAAIVLFRTGDLVGQSIGHLTPSASNWTDRLMDSADADAPFKIDIQLNSGLRHLEVRTRLLPRPGSGQGRLLILRDMTDLQHLQDRLSKVGAIIEEAQLEIYVFSQDSGELHLVSRGARQALGYGESAFPTHVEAINPSLSDQGTISILQRSKGTEPGSFRAVHRRADGTVYPVEVRLQKGELEGQPVVVAFAVDISVQLSAETEQERLRGQLEHAQRMEAIGHLAGGVAHDFNNLLTVMGGCAEALRDEVPPEAMDLVDGLVDAQERGARLTQRLLAFARKEVVQPESLDLGEVVEGVQSLTSRLLTGVGSLQLDVEHGLPINADRGQVEQVILNLVSNARDALPSRSGTVTLRTRDGGEGEAAGQVILEVEDNGAGMTEAVRGRLFEPFFTTKPRGKGTGLGLATVHGIVEQNGGRISIDTAVGAGTTVRVFWPRVEAVDDRQTPAVEGAHGPATILLAEDDDRARDLISRMLSRDGHTVIDVPDGQAALETVDQAAFDLVVTDVVMPRLSGIELSDRLAASHPELPVLLISGYLDEHLPRVAGLGEGRELLLKPFRTDELIGRVRTILEQHRSPPAG